MSASNDRLISGREADAICGTSRSVRYRFLAEGNFPKPIKIGSATRFSERECHQWVAARIAERDGEGRP
jgi:prophage regulatory protein